MKVDKLYKKIIDTCYRNDGKFFMGTFFILFILSLYNLFNNSSFLKLNVSSILTLWIAMFFAFLLNQKEVNNRKLKDQIETLLFKMQNLLKDEYVTKITNEEDKKRTLMFQRSFDNKINILSKLGDNYLDKETLNYIDARFKEYKNIVGDNISDTEVLLNNSIHLERIIENIDHKLDSLIFSLYNLKN